MSKVTERTELFGKDDVMPLGTVTDCSGYIIVLGKERVDEFKKEYRKPEFQLHLACSGFGTLTYTTGNALYTECVGDKECARYERYEFIGILKDEIADEYELGGKRLRDAEEASCQQ